MINRGNVSSVISSYQKRQQRGPFLVWGIAILLVVAGLILLVVWLTGPESPSKTWFATDTPTPTVTYTPTLTFTPTFTATVTDTPTNTATSTPSVPFQYEVKEGDSLAVIVDKFGLGEDGIAKILSLNTYNEDNGTGIDPATQSIYVGQQIWIPNPEYMLPTVTPIPSDVARGTTINYTVQSGDTLDVIASKFNSTTEDIVKQNDLKDANSIYVGQLLEIRVNLVTPTMTRAPTVTPITPTLPVQLSPTSTVSPTSTP
jgi:LysM repeat protein